jgi:hypothetical protein
MAAVIREPKEKADAAGDATLAEGFAADCAETCCGAASMPPPRRAMTPAAPAHKMRVSATLSRLPELVAT